MIVQARGLTRTFGSRCVLGPLDLVLEPGERVAVTGPNGAGKSTLLRCIAGTIAPSSGTVSVDGYRAGSAAARRVIGTSFSQERSFYLRLTGRQNLVTFARLRGPSRRVGRLVSELVAELTLDAIAAERVDRCSSGMIQQLALARALLGDPRVLLLDEPTRSLDGDAADRLWAALERRPRTTVLIATHRPEDVERCERHLALAPS